MNQVFVMHFAGDMPAGFFKFNCDGVNPPWAFHGYSKMEAATEAAAKAEFEKSVNAYWVDQYCMN